MRSSFHWVDSTLLTSGRLWWKILECCFWSLFKFGLAKRGNGCLQHLWRFVGDQQNFINSFSLSLFLFPLNLPLLPFCRIQVAIEPEIPFSPYWAFMDPLTRYRWWTRLLFQWFYFAVFGAEGLLWFCWKTNKKLLSFIYMMKLGFLCAYFCNKSRTVHIRF